MRVLRTFVALCVAFILVAQVSAQEATTFLVRDGKTYEPVENVFIFIENSSIGIITDMNGQAVLPAQDIKFTLVFTHILYETVSISSDQLLSAEYEILLTEKDMSLAEVTVRSTKTNMRQRKKWMKRFEKAFLGQKVSRKKVKLLNPEVLWFEEKGDTLRAYAIDNLKIENKETGYKMQFVLEKFAASVEDEVRYSGKLFFEDIKDSFRKKGKIEKTRDKNYLQSQQLFFRSLVHRHPINKERFEFGQTTANSDGTHTYQQLDADNLTWSFGLSADTLYVDELLTILVNENRKQSFNASGGFGKKKIDISRPTSFLKSKSGRFIIGSDGTLHNQKEIEEFGHWTTIRMAKELPRNYDGSVVFYKSTPSVVVDRLLDYQFTFPSEKVYVHTDKTQYLPYNTMWFKAYVVDAIEHTTITESQVLYVDLINPKDEIINTWILHKDVGLTGDYQWKGADPAGDYRLRAYTNYMRNQGLEFIFEKVVSLVQLSPSETTDNAVTFEQASTDQPSTESLSDGVSVLFYPEGGDLIEGVSNNVTFQARNAQNNYVDIQGIIQDDLGRKVIEIKSTHRGLGRFMLTPEEGRAYHFVGDCEGMVYETQIPIALSSGLSLSVNPNSEEDIYVTIKAGKDQSTNGAFLIGHVRGKIFSFVSGLIEGQNLKFDKSEIPPGIVHFTLFDGQERPHAERLLFNDFGFEEEQLKATLMPGMRDSSQMVDITVEVDSSLISQAFDLSICLKTNVRQTMDGKEDGSKNSQALNIKNYLLLDSDLKDRLPQKKYYLSDITNAKRYQLDLLMLSTHWRRFTWRDIMEKAPASYAHHIEKGYTLSGHTTEKDGTEPVQSHVMLTALDASLIHDKISTDDQGRFSFTQLPTFDSTTYFLQGRMHDGPIDESGEITKMRGDRLLDIHIDDFAPLGVTDPLSMFYKHQDVAEEGSVDDERLLSDKALFTLREEYLQKIETDSSMWTIDAPEVSIRARRNHTSNRPLRGTLALLDNMDWIEPSAQGKSLLTMLAPRRAYRSGPDPSKIYSVFTNRVGEQVIVPINIIIDGMGGESGGDNAGHFLGLNADRIESIYIGKTFISITTRARPRSIEKRLSSGIIYIDHPGYYKARQFSPDFTAEGAAAFETTLHWDPDFIIDNDGQAKFSIPQPRLSSSFIIEVQGVTDRGEIINLVQQLNSGH